MIRFPVSVTPGLDPEVHVDGRVKAGHDEKECVIAF
jgi:hypothetical protein